MFRTEQHRKEACWKMLVALREFGYPTLKLPEVEEAVAAYESGNVSNTNVIHILVQKFLDEAKSEAL